MDDVLSESGKIPFEKESLMVSTNCCPTTKMASNNTFGFIKNSSVLFLSSLKQHFISLRETHRNSNDKFDKGTMSSSKVENGILSLISMIPTTHYFLYFSVYSDLTMSTAIVSSAASYHLTELLK